MRIRLAHSPDPDDAFMFYGLACGAVDPGPYQFEHILEDIQSLNERARRGEYEVTALSIHAYPHVADKYVLTACGSSMGDNYGPLVVAREPMKLAALVGRTIAVPGLLTTAYLALQLAFRELSAASSYAPAPRTPAGASPARGDASRAGASGNSVTAPRAAFETRLVMFDQIPDEVAAGRCDAGLLIHEGQLTYARYGLRAVLDLGVWWQQRTGFPLPLGGNAVRRDLGDATCRDIARIVRATIRYGLEHRDAAVRYALQFGRGLDHDLADRFVGMYVNEWTLDYGERGRAAVRRLLAEGTAAGLVPDAGEIEFL